MKQGEREKLNPPKPGKVLLHSCCAPCAGELMEAMTESQVDYSIYFYSLFWAHLTSISKIDLLL